MGFRTGAYCKVWEVKVFSNTMTQLRISISKKNKDTGEYITEFSGFVACVGSGAAGKAAKLKEGDRIKLGDVDVRTKYDADKNTTYTNYSVFSFEEQGGSHDSVPDDPTPPNVDDGEQEDRDLPF